MAGLDAGLVYNTWPKFGQKWWPHELTDGSLKIDDFFNNPAIVQFTHRNLVRFFDSKIFLI